MAKPEAHRKFYEFPSENVQEDSSRQSRNDPEKFIEYVSSNIIGSNTVFSSPFGPRKAVYCDCIASGRSVRFIEDFILNEVLPQYGSTHTTSSVTALQTTLFRHESREIIRNITQASEHDRVLFVGSGATGAIHKLIHGLRFQESPVVIVDPFSHHSSILPWREIGAKVIRIRENSAGDVDLDHLEETLKHHKDARHLIGCFTAASNITGVIVDDIKITTLLHTYGALAFWDYATAAPYVELKVNPVVADDSLALAHKDAVFFSMHKFLGGVQTPGILIAKKHLFKNPVPEVCGGGTVFFVTRGSHRYLQDVETKEEGGTPAVVEAIRAGLVMQLKNNITSDFILTRHKLLNKKIAELVHNTPQLVPIGNVDFENRIPILSFVVRHSTSGLFLHHNFVCSILNDLFGIQARGGCMCAGPYAQDLLGIDEDLALKFEKLLVEDKRLDRSHLRRHREHSDMEVIRPGVVRLNLPFYFSDEQVDFILSAVKEVCINGWRLLPQYILNPETGEWKHHTNLVFKKRMWLQSISYDKGVFSFEKKDKGENEDVPSYEECLISAKNTFEEAAKASQRRQVPDDTILFREEAAELRWFVLPSEAKTYINKLSALDSVMRNQYEPPFSPSVYPLSDKDLRKRHDFIWDRKDKDFNHSKESILSEKINISSDGSAIKSNNSDQVDISSAGIFKVDNDSSKSGKEYENKTVSRKSKVICDDLKCFIKREDTKPLQEITKVKWHSPPKNIFNPTVEALQEFNMIQNGDRILVCLSGGKDSLSLLHVLRQYQYYAKSRGVDFTLGAVTVDPMSASYDPRPLIPYLASLGVPYFFEQQDILKQAAELETLNSICSYCSRMKRGRIYAAARRESYNVLAFGQHLDDLAESFIMSIFHNGRLRTMKAHYSVREEDLRVIRPFVYVREKDLRVFAESKKLPVIPENCPACFEAPKERHRVKQMLAQQEVLFPGLYWSLRTALHPVMAIKITGIENEMFGKNGRIKSSPLAEVAGNGNDEDDEDENI
ncbi:uncharacterized protein [Palaemon carinicauda]|uniref:uncharacterized protein n=1 Tax=Palaemon carinicauda TaxID=392227 RepID=UPI0035B6944E